MEHINQLRQSLPDSTKDLRLNLSTVLQNQTLSPQQTWSVALTCAYFLGTHPLRDALLADAAGILSPEDIGDAQAAASLMGMNTVYYRFRHMMGKESYHQQRAGLRMNRMLAPATSKAQFELCALACAALAGCETCLHAHEASLLKEGLTEQHVHDTIRIAATVQGVAVAMHCTA